jgi:sortase A
MTDRRSAEELSVEELEEILKRKRKEARAERLRRIASAEGERKGRMPPDLAAFQERHRGQRWKKGSGPRTMVRPPRGQPIREKVAGKVTDSHLFHSPQMRPLNPNPIEETSRSFAQDLSAFWQTYHQRIRDGALLAVELGALLGLVLILFSSLSSLRLLNDEVAEAQRRGSSGGMTAIQADVLPGGSTPPDSTDLPEPYAHMASETALITIPTPGPKQATRVVIPSIEVDAMVVEGDGWEELKKGAGHHIGSANPGEKGNCVISAHNDVFGEVFRDIQHLESGDEITVYAGDMPYKHLVRAKRVVDPSEVSVMDPTPDPILTLITCHPYMIDTQRMIVVAELVGSEEK